MTMLALAVLCDACHRAQAGPVVRTNALRLALAYLFTRSNGDRRPYDLFWSECADGMDFASSQGVGNVCRSAWLTREWNSILATLGIAPTIEFGERLAKVTARERREFEAVHGQNEPKV